jgi:hypothetical protein
MASVRCCAVPGCAYLHEPVLHLCVGFCAAPGATEPVLHLKWLSTKYFVLHLNETSQKTNRKPSIQIEFQFDSVWNGNIFEGTLVTGNGTVFKEKRINSPYKAVLEK